MTRIQTFAAINIIALLTGTGIPAMTAQYSDHVHSRGPIQQQSANQGGNQGRNDNANRNLGNQDRGVSRHAYEAERSYQPTPIYQAAPVYDGPVYRTSCDYGPSYNGRTAAIVGGTAAAGALIGAAVDRGEEM